MWDRSARGAPDERNEWSNNLRGQGERPQPASAPLNPVVHDWHYAKQRLRLALVEVLERGRLLRARKWSARRTTLAPKQTGVAISVSTVTRWRRRIALARLDHLDADGHPLRCPGVITAREPLARFAGLGVRAAMHVGVGLVVLRAQAGLRGQVRSVGRLGHVGRNPVDLRSVSHGTGTFIRSLVRYDHMSPAVSWEVTIWLGHGSGLESRGRPALRDRYWLHRKPHPRPSASSYCRSAQRGA